MNQIDVKRRQIEAYTHILEMLSILLLGGVLGSVGIAYAAAAFECTMVIWYLLGRRSADTLGKMFRARRNKGQYRNADMVGRNVFICQTAAGMFGTLLLIVCAKPLAVNLLHLPYIASVIVAFAPAVFLRIVSAALMGHMQGEGEEMLGILTGVLRQVLFFVLALLFGRALVGYGEKVSALLGQGLFRAMYGALGIAIAYSVTEAVIAGVLSVLAVKKRMQRKREFEEGMRTTDSFGDSVRIFYANMSMGTIVNCLERLFVWVGILLYMKKMGNEESALVHFGILYGKYIMLCGLAVLPICAALTAVYARAMFSIRRDEKRYAQRHFQSGIHIGVTHGLFFVVFASVMAEELAGIFGRTQKPLLAQMLKSGSLVVLFLVLDYYFIGLLMLMGQKLVVMGVLAAANLLCAIFMRLLIGKMEEPTLALIYGAFIGSAVVCAALGFFCLHLLRCGIDWLNVLAIPAGGALVTGLVALLIEKLLASHMGDFLLTLLVFVISAVVYWSILLIARNFKEQELKLTLVGHLIYQVGHSLNLV